MKRASIGCATWFGLAAMLAACASKPPLDAAGVSTITPAAAAANAQENGRVLWGGVIVQTTNLKDASQIEVVGFPLDKNQEPETGKQPVGRFVILKAGYLESAEYAGGRRITVLGQLSGRREGRIGETPYTYPVVAPEQMHLWPQPDQERPNNPQFHFGIGVGAIFH